MDNARTTLAKNLQAMMGATEGYDTQEKVRKKAKLSQSTMSRAVNGKVAVTLDTLEALAAVYKLQPWQLLMPEMDPTNPPALPVTAAEKALYRAMIAAMKEQKEKHQ